MEFTWTKPGRRWGTVCRGLLGWPVKRTIYKTLCPEKNSNKSSIYTFNRFCVYRGRLVRRKSALCQREKRFCARTEPPRCCGAHRCRGRSIAGNRLWEEGRAAALAGMEAGGGRERRQELPAPSPGKAEPGNVGPGRRDPQEDGWVPSTGERRAGTLEIRDGPEGREAMGLVTYAS